jgi:DNA gyrase inhibitor GyrI
MDRLKKAEESLSKLNDVRIIYLPPATVAAAHHIGDDPEQHAYRRMDAFVRDTNLCKIKPDIRHYGFNHPNPVDETQYQGYEIWVTIPEDMEVPPFLTKKQFSGGLYAAHMIAMGNFHEWEWLFEWVSKNERYEFAGDMQDQEHMCGLLDEHLNYVSHIHLDNTEPEDLQIDLLMPIRERLN